MEGLQRSQISFRRQGSSGLVWDDKLISGELNPEKPSEDQDPSSADHQKPELRRTKSDGGNKRAYRTVKVQEAEDPPSPRLSGCGFCSAFANKSSSSAQKTDKRKSGKRKSAKK